ncbi:MAG: ABC transporter permease [Chloroflexi bacterium]|nr:ABC transporter permease [Chloroflexota bacterium]
MPLRVPYEYRRLGRLLLRDKVALLALLILLAVVVIAIFAPAVAPDEPDRQDLDQRLLPPAWTTAGTAQHLLGTDALGRDNLSRVIFASRVSLAVGGSVIGITLVIGTTLGLLSGYFRGKLDDLVMAITDSIMAFPGLLMILAVAALMGPGLTTIIAALSVRFWTTYARVTRGLVMSIREEEYITAARALGGSELRSVWVHVIPNILSPLMALIPLELGRVMLAEASVSFLGLGVQSPMTSWGMLVAEGRDYISRAWWLITFAGLALFMTILASNMLGSWLRLSTDPMHRRRLEA